MPRAATVTRLDADERLIRDGEAAAERWYEARTEILPMALGFLAAKRKYPATQDLNEWLRGSPYGKINATDRAALIKIGEHAADEEHADRTAAFLRSTDLISPRLILKALEAAIATSHDVNSTETGQELTPRIDPTIATLVDATMQLAGPDVVLGYIRSLEDQNPVSVEQFDQAVRAARELLGAHQ